MLSYEPHLVANLTAEDFNQFMYIVIVVCAISI